VGAGLVQIGVAGDDIEVNRGGLRLSRGGDEERVCRVGEARDDLGRHVHAAARNGGLEQGPQVERGSRGNGEIRSVRSGSSSFLLPPSEYLEYRTETVY